MQRMIMYMIKCDNMSRNMSIICPKFMSNDNVSINDRIKRYEESYYKLYIKFLTIFRQGQMCYRLVAYLDTDVT